MNVLELLLQRIRSPGGSGGSVFDRLHGSRGGLAGPDQSDQAPPVEVPDLLLRAPGQGGFREQLHPNALGVYGRPGRPPPVGDVVLRPGQVGDFDPITPLIPPSMGVRSRNQLMQPDYFPGPGGGTRISARQSDNPGVAQSTGPGLSPAEMAMLQGMRQREEGALPADLPEAVRRSILGQPSYEEGVTLPGPSNPLMEQEFAAGAFAGPLRETPLMQGLNDVRNMNRTTEAIPEGWGLTSRPAGQSPFASPLNQMMQWGQRAPFALY